MSKVVINKCYGSAALSDKALQFMREHGYEWFENTYDIHKIDRHDPTLVECIETLGKEANGFLSDLEAVDIGDSKLYRIQHYDGMEEVILPQNEEYIIIQ